MEDLLATSGTELNLYDADLTSLADIKDLPAMTHLRSLNLHRNRISAIEGLDFLSQLLVLDLSSNDIQRITGLDGCYSLRVLNLSANRIAQIEGLAALQQLKKLVLSYNHISGLEGMAQLHGVHYKLEYLDLTGNQIDRLDQLEYLSGCVNLRCVHLQLAGGRHANAVCERPEYKHTMLGCVRQLSVLDHSKVHVEVGRPEAAGLSMEYPELAAYLRLIERPKPALEDDEDLDADSLLSSSLDDLPAPLKTPHVDEFLYRTRPRGRRTAHRGTGKAEELDDDGWLPGHRAASGADDRHSPGAVCAGHDGRAEGRRGPARGGTARPPLPGPPPLTSPAQDWEVEMFRRKAAERSLEACTAKLEQQQRRVAEAEAQAAAAAAERAAEREAHAAERSRLLEDAKAQCQHLQAKVEALEAELARRREEAQASHASHGEAAAEAKALQDRLAEADRQHTTLQDAVQRAEGRAGAAEQEVDRLRLALAASDAELRVVVGRASELQSTLNSQLLESQKAVVSLTTKVEETAQLLAQRTAELDTCRQDCQSHQRTVAVLKEELDRAVAEQARLQEAEAASRGADREREAAVLRAQEAQAWYEDQLRRVTEEWRRSSDEGARGERGRLQRMAEECAELQAAVKEQRRTIDKLTASSCRYRADAQELQAVVSHQEGRLQELTQSCREAMLGREEALRRYEEEEALSRTRAAELLKVEGRLGTAQKRIAGLEAELKKTAAEKADLQYSAQQHEVEQVSLQSQLDVARLEGQSKADCIKALRAEVAELRRRLEAEAIAPQQSEALAFYEAKCSQLSLRVTELDAALAQKSQAAGEQEKQLAARDQSIAKLKELVNDKVREATALEAADHGRREEAQQLRREVANLKAALRDKEEALRELQAELAELDDQMRDLADSNGRKRGELEELRRKEKEAAKRIGGLEAALAEREEAVSVALAQTKLKGDTSASLQTRLREREVEVEQLQARAAQRDAELSRLQAQLAEAAPQLAAVPALQGRVAQLEAELQRVLHACGDLQAALQQAEQDGALLRSQLQQAEFDRRMADHRAAECEQKLHHQKKYLKRMMGAFDQ